MPDAGKKPAKRLVRNVRASCSQPISSRLPCGCCPPATRTHGAALLVDDALPRGGSGFVMGRREATDPPMRSGHFDGGREDIAGAAHRLDHGGLLRVGLELAAQA